MERECEVMFKQHLQCKPCLVDAAVVGKAAWLFLTPRALDPVSHAAGKQKKKLDILHTQQHFLYGTWKSAFISTSRPDSNHLEMKSMDAFASRFPRESPFIPRPVALQCDIGQDWARSRDTARKKALL